GGGTRHNDGVPPLAGHGFLSVRSIEGERGRVGEWVSGRGVEWVRDTRRSQTQSVSHTKPPPLAGHTLPVVKKDRGREGESGRVGEGHKEKAILSVCLHGESRSGRGTQREAELS